MAEGEDVFTEPDADPDTLAHLGPLRALAGIWEGTSGSDAHPSAGGEERNEYVERYELDVIDPQTNGPQLLYGLRYHTHITKPFEVETFHDQVGYWLYEPATSAIFHTIAIPRGQAVLAIGHADADATEFEVHASLGDPVAGICSNPFLDHAFRTLEVTVRVATQAGADTWSYDEDTVLEVLGRDAPFHHTDRHSLRRVAPAQPNPLVAGSLERDAVGSQRHVAAAMHPEHATATGPTAPRSP